MNKTLLSWRMLLVLALLLETSILAPLFISKPSLAAHAAPTEWNSLPSTIRNITVIETFENLPVYSGL